MTTTPITIERANSSAIAGAPTAQNAAVQFNINYPAGWATANFHKIRIHNITATAELSTTGDMGFDLNFFGKDTYQSTGVDTTAEDFMGSVSFAMSDSELITGSAMFRYTKDLADSPMFYEDLDMSGEVHVSLVVRTATDFAAADSIKITLMVEPIF